MSNSPPHIPNFQTISDLLKKSNQNPDNLGYILGMMALEGYDEWLAWMKQYRPDELP